MERCERRRVLANKERASASISLRLIYYPTLLNMMSLQPPHKSTNEATHTTAIFTHNPPPSVAIKPLPGHLGRPSYDCRYYLQGNRDRQ